jgi:hypothetical protein
LNYQKDRNFIERVVNENIRIPKIKRVSINRIIDNYPPLKTFFLHSFPENVDLLFLHIDAVKRFKFDYYMPTLAHALRRTHKEIYFN